jgi:hypothetical protein
MIARYPLSRFIASFDFYDWLVLVQAKGATEIVFDVENPKTVKWPADVVMERFRTIIEPGPLLADMPWRFGTDGDEIASPHMTVLMDHVKSGGTFKRLASILPANRCRYTVTLRNCDRIPERNSNQMAWREFAEEIGAVVIEDHADKPINLHDRVALYAGAEMNFGIVNGPMHLITLTDYPVMMFATKASHKGFREVGMHPLENYPWCLPHQKIVWAEDDLDSLRKQFRNWCP